MPARIADENLSVACGCTGHEVFQSAESHLAAAAVECASVADRRVAVLTAHLEGVPAAQNGQIIDVLENVVRPIVLRETGAATDLAGKGAQSDVGKTAVRLRRTVTEGDAIVRLTVSRARAVGGLEPLIKPAVPESGGVDHG